jgi:myosin heavy subunit
MVQKSSAIYREELVRTKAALEKLENERKERENADEIHQQALREEEELLTIQRDLQTQQQEVNVIISDGSSRLQAAIRKKDSISIDSASILIEGGNVRSKSISEQLSKVTDDLIKIQNKRKDAHRSVQQYHKRQKATDTID